MVRIVMMALHSCSKKKCGRADDWLKSVWLSVCALLFPVLLVFIMKGFEVCSNTRNTNVVFLFSWFQCLLKLKKEHKWILVCFDEQVPQFHVSPALAWSIKKKAVEKCYMVGNVFSIFWSLVHHAFWWETLNVNKIVFVCNTNSTGYLFF